MIETDRRTFIAGAGMMIATESTPAAAGTQMKTRLIATEEGFAVPETMAATSAWLERNPEGEPGYRVLRKSFGIANASKWVRDLIDLGDGRAQAMDAAGIDTQLLLHGSPGVQIFGADEGSELAALVNDRITSVAAGSPRRYAPLATIAPQAPERAALELERAVRNLGHHGALINSHTRGEYLDERKYWPIFEAAQALDVPIYIHPREPAPSMVGPYEAYGLAGAIWGFAADTGLHALRLILAGVFDEFPRLQIVLGHLGEGLPFFIDRIDIRYKVDGSPQRTALKMLPSDYLKRNFHLTTSGMNWEPAVRQALEVMGPDHIQFAADWPFEDAVDAAQRFRAMKFDPATHAKIAHRNAERVWRIQS